jgi:hypothetical protein
MHVFDGYWLLALESNAKTPDFRHVSLDIPGT